MNLKFVSIIFILVNYTKQTLPGIQKALKTNTVVAPVQFPGILNPDIYVQNVQSNPIIPEVNPPSINMSLHVDGLEKYYKPDPLVIHHFVHKRYGNKYDKMANRIKKALPTARHITLNVNPFRVDDPEDLLDPTNVVHLGNIFSNTRRSLSLT